MADGCAIGLSINLFNEISFEDFVLFNQLTYEWNPEFFKPSTFT